MKKFRALHWFVIATLIGIFGGCSSAPPEDLLEGTSTFHLVKLKLVFTGQGKPVYIKNLASNVQMYESSGQIKDREDAAKKAKPYDKSKETFFYFIPHPNYPESKDHMLLIGREQVDKIVAQEEKSTKERLAKEQKIREAERKKQAAEQAERDAIEEEKRRRLAAEKEACLSNGDLGVCMKDFGNKSTYLCGSYGITSGSAFLILIVITLTVAR